MITIPDSAKKEEVVESPTLAIVHPEPPPSYHASEPNSPSSSTSTPPQSPTNPLPRATNFTTFFKPLGPVKGTWVIDPSLSIPASLRIETPGEPERNLFLRSEKGSIQAEVTVLRSSPPAPSEGKDPRTVLEAATVAGSIRLGLHDGPEDPAKVRQPVKLTLSTTHGSIRLRIPRSFRGVIDSVCHWGSTELSDEVTANMSFSQVEGIRRKLFVGEFGDKDFNSADTWLGDEIKAETKFGSITISYDDESKEEKRKSTLSKLFSSIF